MDQTTFLGLTRMYLPDNADKRIDNLNWDILDRWASTHIHNGQDSELIDLSEIWEAIEELRRKDIIHEDRMSKIEILAELRFQAYLRHRHYSLTAPPSLNTLWFDTFVNYNQLDTKNSTAILNTDVGFVSLPPNYLNNRNYYVVTKPFVLNKEDGFAPSEAVVHISMAQKGIVTPLLKIGNNILPTDNPRIYQGIISGSQDGDIKDDSSTKTYYNFKNKKIGNENIPHRAWHHVDLANKRPALSLYHKEYVNNIEFDNTQYQGISNKDGIEISTGPKYQDAVAVYKRVSVPLPVPPKPLHNSIQVFRNDQIKTDNKVLSWSSESNTFSWLDTETNNFDIINSQEIEPLTEEGMVEVAAAKDKETGLTWVLKTKVVATDNPTNTFKVMHQFVSWDGDKEFTEHEWWTSASKMDRRNWPPRVIAPNRLVIDHNSIHAIVELDPAEVIQEGNVAYNYYESNADYQWFPFRKLFGETFNFSDSVKFVYFNPGLLATIMTIPKAGTLTAKGTAKFIRGAYSPTSTQYSLYTDRKIEEFEGGNTSTFLGEFGDEIFFYQSFVPYNGASIKENEPWTDQTWIDSNPDVSWHGIVGYNIQTGANRYVRDNVPFIANVSGGIDNESVVLAGGIELVKQFVSKDNRIIGTVDNNPPENIAIKFAYWVDKQIPGVNLAQRASIREDVSSPYLVNLSDGSVTREGTEIEAEDINTSTSRINNARMVISPTGFSTVGGVSIEGRSAIRPRTKDVLVRKAIKWNGKLVDGQVARQVFQFKVGNFIQETDQVRLRIKARSEGVKPQSFSTTPDPAADINIFRFSYSGAGSRAGGTRQGAWTLVRRMNNQEPEQDFIIPGNDIIRGRPLWIMVENRRETNKKRRVASILRTDFIEVTVRRQSYVYTYKWDNLPDGDTAALALECSTSGLPDVNGVEVYSADLSIISSPIVA